MQGRSNIRFKPQTPYVQHTRLTYVLVAVALTYFAIMASRQIALPGLYNDEVVYVNPALGAAVARRVHGIPVMVMPYVGALKAYLYFPIFALFGVSAETIRLPAVFISLLTLGLTFKLARLMSRPLPSAVLVLLMAADPIFIFMTKADYGPIVLMMFFKILALYFFLRFILTSSPRYLWGLAVACGLGLYDKLNFIWFVLALIVAAAVVFRQEFRLAAAQRRAHFIWPVGALLLLVVSSVLYAMPLFVHAQGRLAQTQSYDAGPLERIAFVLRLYIRTMDSRDMWFMRGQFITGTLTNWITLAIIGMIVIGGASGLVRRKPLAPALTDRMVTFYLLLFVIILTQIVATNAADSPNHILMVYPFHYMLLISLVNRLADLHVLNSPSKGWRLAAASPGLGVMAVIVLLIVSEIAVGLRYQEAMDERRFNHLWSPAIYELAAYVDRRDVDAIVSANWGIHQQVFALSRPEARRRYVKLWEEFTELDGPEQERRLAERFFQGRRVLGLVYVVDQAVDRGAATARQHFLSFAEHYFGGAVLERVIANDRGEPIFGVYYLDARTR